MPKKRKKRKYREPENERYEIEVENWEVYCRFGINKVNRDIIPGDYWEYSSLILVGSILSPTLKQAARENPPLAIGCLEIPRGEDILTIYCWVPSRSFRHISMAVDSGKIKYASLFGTKLKWRRGKIFEISFSMNREEE